MYTFWELKFTRLMKKKNFNNVQVVSKKTRASNSFLLYDDKYKICIVI